MKPIRVMVTDDHEVVRSGLMTRLAREADLEVVGYAANANDAVGRCLAWSPDVLVLDLHLMNGANGLQVISQVRQAGSKVKILVFSYDSEFIFAVLEAGAAGYLLKSEPLDQVVLAVRGIYHGEGWWFSKDVTARLARGKDWGATPLSHRELDVLRLLAQGYRNDQIGARLSISKHTVKHHVTHIFDKLGLESRCAAVAHAWQHGLVVNTS